MNIQLQQIKELKAQKRAFDKHARMMLAGFDRTDKILGSVTRFILVAKKL